MKVGDIFDTYECIKRTPTKIYLNNGLTIRYHYYDSNNFYIASNKKIKVGRKSVDYINQILRDIEGWLVYNIHSNNEL